ncbi:MAG: carboxypeptidase-like regulatory domain-containing protein [Terracidiphilus sp.]
MKNRRIGVCALLMVTAVCVVNATQTLAQQPKNGQISGHVVDEVGATIKGASVFVRRNIPPEQNVRLLMHTDIHGDFMLVLPQGGYDVFVTSPGFAAAVETVPVSAGRTKKVQWKLKSLGCSFPGMNCDTFQ